MILNKQFPKIYADDSPAWNDITRKSKQMKPPLGKTKHRKKEHGKNILLAVLRLDLDDFTSTMMETHHLDDIDYLKKSSKHFKNATGNCDFASSRSTYDCKLVNSYFLVRNTKYKMKLFTKPKEVELSK